MRLLAFLSLASIALASCGRGHPDDAVDAGPPDLVLSTLYGDQWLLADTHGGAQARYDLAARHPSPCAAEGWRCLGYQARPRVALDGEVEVVFTFSALNDQDGAEDDREDRLGTLAGASAESLELRWEVDQLDFSGLPDGADHCTWDEADPCLAAADLPDRDFQRCRLYQPHDVQVIDEDAEGLELWVSDSRNARFLRLRVERGEGCAQVEEVLGAEHPDWSLYNAPNSFQWWEDSAGEHLLWSAKDSFEGQGGGDGMGRILYWTRDGAGWSRRWEFPSDGGFVNSPHGLTRWPAEGPGEGEPQRLLFAHSLGLGAGWNEGPGGTLMALEWDEDGARYLGDWTLPRGFNYPRDVLVDGARAWVADSGCKGGVDCDRAMGLYEVALPQDPQPVGLSGAWSLDGAQQAVGELELLSGPFAEAERLIYSVERYPVTDAAEGEAP